MYLFIIRTFIISSFIIGCIFCTTPGCSFCTTPRCIFCTTPVHFLHYRCIYFIGVELNAVYDVFGLGYVFFVRQLFESLDDRVLAAGICEIHKVLQAAGKAAFAILGKPKDDCEYLEGCSAQTEPRYHPAADLIVVVILDFAVRHSGFLRFLAAGTPGKP